ncbi:MAG: M1 family aminopeptidase [Chitinophagaceae bacterium]
MKTRLTFSGIAPLSLLFAFSFFALSRPQKSLLRTSFEKVAPENVIPYSDTPVQHPCRFVPAAKGGADEQMESTGFSGTGANIDVLYHKIYWRINPDTTVNYIKGSVQTNFRTIDPAVSTISFDLRSVLTIDSVVFRNAKLPGANISRTGNIVTLTLGVTLPNNFIDSLTIYYQGTPPPPASAAQGYQRSTDANAGNFISTLSESYEDRDWWPCKADMQDKIDSMDITVNVPWGSPTAADTFWVATNGKLVDSTISGGNRSFVFKTRYPIASYLVCVAVARFNRYYRNVDINGTPVQVVYNLFRGKTAGSYNTILTSMDLMNTVIQAFSSKYSDYPFRNEKHGYYEGLEGAGGMEHQTFSAISSFVLSSRSVLAHELSHQWFGDNVTFGTWNDLWLAEGFAQYSEALAAELVPALGLNAFTIRNNFKSSALSSNVTVWIPDANIGSSNLIWNSGYGGAVYSRGGMIVSMLRALAGDTKFFQALQNYQTGLKGKSASADSLKNYFNAVLGRDITPFFNDYVGGSGNGATPVGGKGNPVNSINWNTPVSNRLVVQVGLQTQSPGSNVSYFRGPVVLHLKGATALQDTTITFFDWGGGNLSYAGNGISAPVTGNKLGYNLSFTPLTVLYDDSARTMSTGSTTFTPGLNDQGFSFSVPTPVAANCPAPASMNAVLATISNSGFTNPITLAAVSGVPAGTTVSFSPNPVTPGSNATVTLSGTNTLAPGTYNITVQGTPTGANTETVTVSFVINPGSGPVITAQPADQLACAGTNATFTVAGSATAYQWQVSTDGGNIWTPISGAVSASLVISNVTTGANGNRYRCIVSNTCGNTVSAGALLTVNTPVTITAQPQPATICAGQSTTLCIAATGTSPQYQWQTNTTGCGGAWVNITGAVSSCYTLTNAAATAYYRCNVTVASCGTVASACVPVDVIQPVSISTQPADVAVCAGGDAVFTAAGTSSQPVNYQWQVSTDGGTVYTQIPGATAAVYTVNNAGTALNNNRYRCALTNTTCTNPVFTSAAKLTVRALPVTTLSATPLTSLLPGQVTTLTPAVAGSGGTVQLNWQYNGAPLTVSGNTYQVNVEQTGQYTVRAQESFAGGLVCTGLPGSISIDAAVSDKLFIFPSPNNGRFTVSYYNSGGGSEKRTVLIYDAKGSQVYQQVFTISGAYTLLPVDLQRAGRGIYYVRVGNAAGTVLASGKVHVR